MAPHELRAPLREDNLAAVLTAGIEVNSAELGLLDFPSVVEGTPAY